MSPAPTSPLPHLAPPGAGLPKPELIVARLMFGWHRLTTTRTKAAHQITAERDKMLALARGCGLAAAGPRVLIPRLRGIEDSSRYWSVFMTLEHVRIVNAGIEQTIALLVQGRTPDRVASTATLKPSPEVGAEAVETFMNGCESLTRTVAAVPHLRTAARYAHPWFGALDADGWHILAGFHMNLHRRQIESILTHLAAERAAE